MPQEGPCCGCPGSTALGEIDPESRLNVTKTLLGHEQFHEFDKILRTAARNDQGQKETTGRHVLHPAGVGVQDADQGFLGVGIEAPSEGRGGMQPDDEPWRG